MESLLLMDPPPLSSSVAQALGVATDPQAMQNINALLRQDLVAMAQAFLHSPNPSDGNRKITLLFSEGEETESAARELAEQCQASPAPYAGSLALALVTAVDAAFDRGARSAMVLSSLAPSLPSHIVDHGFRALRFHPRVLGPDMAGGIYLLGFGRATAAGLEELDWSPMPSVHAIGQQWPGNAAPHWLPFWYQWSDAAQIQIARQHAQSQVGQGAVQVSTAWLKREGQSMAPENKVQGPA